MELDYFIERRNYLQAEIPKLRRTIEKYPPGELVIYEQNGYTKWQIYGADKSGEMQYVKKKDQAKAEMMTQKKIDCLRLQDLENELLCIDQYLATRCEPDWSSIFGDGSHYKELIPKKSDWEYQPYRKKQGFQDSKYTPAPKGELVRSKSEAMIAYCLYENGIPYHYEEEYELFDILIAPDFTIKHPKTGELFIWEHFGKAEQKKYQGYLLSKLPIYLDSGFIPGKNFIMTFETQDEKLSIMKVNRIIQETFLN